MERIDTALLPDTLPAPKAHIDGHEPLGIQVLLTASSMGAGIGDLGPGLGGRLTQQFNIDARDGKAPTHALLPNFAVAMRSTTQLEHVRHLVEMPTLRNMYGVHIIAPHYDNFEKITVDKNGYIETAKQEVPFNRSMANVREMIRLSIAHNMLVMVVGMPNIDGSQVIFPTRKEGVYMRVTEKNRLRSENGMRDEANRAGAIFIDMWNKYGDSIGRRAVHTDRIHPGVAGHEYLFGEVMYEIDHFANQKSTVILPSQRMIDAHSRMNVVESLGHERDIDPPLIAREIMQQHVLPAVIKQPQLRTMVSSLTSYGFRNEDIAKLTGTDTRRAKEWTKGLSMPDELSGLAIAALYNYAQVAFKELSSMDDAVAVARSPKLASASGKTLLTTIRDIVRENRDAELKSSQTQ